jgi:peptide/nickel transport system permease protein
MLAYVIRRTTLAIIIASLAVATLYCLVQAAPGDPINILLGPRGTDEMRAALEARLGLDQPLPIQILKFFEGILQGDLGTDIKSNRPVAMIVAERLPNTIALLASALALAAVLGIPLGCFAATHRDSLADRIIGAASVSVIAIPPLIVAIYGLLIFAAQLKWIPAIGAGESGDLLDQLHHLIMPAIAVGLGWIGYVARLVRASMLEILNEDFIRNARAFGLPERVIIFRYALRIAVAPTVTVLGIGVGYMIGSAVFAEIVFSRPGIGKLMYDALLVRNYPVIMGAVLASTGILITTTTLADIINAFLDPRIRKGQE